jgi:hypothetical protein
MPDAIDIVTAGLPEIDDCPVLTRIKAFVVQEGIRATLQHVMRDRQGRVLDLTPVDTEEVSEESEESASASTTTSVDTVKMRVKEFVGDIDGNQVVTHEVSGTIADAATGIVQARLPTLIVSRAGLYQLSWGFYRDSVLKIVNDGLLSVERSLYGNITEAPAHNGPPTISEIRMQMMDSSPAENLLLDDVEFNDEQIALAITKPIMDFNESLPPLNTLFNTLNFPWRSHWLDATIAYLYRFAAAGYRRNRLATRAGGVDVDDKNKEAEYLRMSQLMLEEWKKFVLMRKTQLNGRAFTGAVGSPYG